ncbi:peptide cross-linking via chondroitin 4-sulfate glycosaminoglycan [Homalodisca vitripennis]|nr:peptide cross-linking via chondroitin 4-sulfate glycosaminoglycan [Homalodisca vitripennis]
MDAIEELVCQVLHVFENRLFAQATLCDLSKAFDTTREGDNALVGSGCYHFGECYPCPIVKPTFLCGTDNRTYSSLCRLDYHNCLHHTNIRVLCKGFCPCKDGDLHMRKKQKQAELMSNFMTKYKNTVGTATANSDKPKSDKQQSVADKYTFTPQDFKYENKHYKYIKYTKHDNKISKANTILYHHFKYKLGPPHTTTRDINIPLNFQIKCEVYSSINSQDILQTVSFTNAQPNLTYMQHYQTLSIAY